MAKRRRSAASMDAREDEDLHVPPMSILIKRRKKSVNLQDPGEVIQELYDIIRTYKNEEGRLLCEPLIRVPKRRSVPDYYEVVTNPIDLLKIQQRMKTEEYDTVEDMVHDVELMINNAQAYYKKSSQEYKDASDLWAVFLQSKRELLEKEDIHVIKGPLSSSKDDQQSFNKPQDVAESSGSAVKEESVAMEEDDSAIAPSEPVEESGYIVENPEDPLELLFTAVMGHRDATGRIVSLMFRKLPQRHEFPGYYEVIDNPIDLCDIAIKIRSKKYDRLHDLEKDLLLMVKNAKTFNEPGSQIYKDAITLKKVISSKKSELERAGKEVHHSSKSRRSSTHTHSQSALAEALILAGYENREEEVKEEATPTPVPPPPPPPAPAPPPSTPATAPTPSIVYEENDDDSESFSMDVSDSLHVLFDFIVNFRNSLGQIMSEPFMRLPNSRMYPDYYEEIKKPMALSKIRTKLKQNKFKSLDELSSEIELVFKNAMQYNMSSSQLYKDAEKLQKAMLHKKKELDKAEVKKELESEDEGSEKGGRRRRSGVPVWKSRRSDTESTLKTKMMSLYQSLVHFQDETGRNPITLFMEKPSKKEYPDYYHIITEPIDMKTIESNIRHDRYFNEEMLMKDFHLMFNNARHYNEEGSMVYEDANRLERRLKEKWDSTRSTTPKSQTQKKTPVKRSPVKSLSPLGQKLNDLYNSIKDYVDPHGRELSAPFIRLPSKNEYPEYYQVIKRPMDMQRIQQRVMSRQYDQLDDMVNDFLLMFDNACKFNEPDSLIYKDALTLQRILLQTKTELMGDETSGVPDVQGLVREILTSLFVSVANHQDEEGRCYSDSLAEIPVDKEANSEEQSKPLNLDTIRRYLDRGCYRRLDCFQDHIFDVLERARNLSRTDSQVYEDSIEIQRFFIQIRDEICKNGEILLSPALSYTHRHLQNDLDNQKREKIPKEMKEDSEKKEEEEAKKDQMVEENESKTQEDKEDDNDDGLVVSGVTYRVGDFVYVEPSEKQLKNHIVCIEKLWRDADGEVWLHGNWFLRPNETFHLATRKFMEKEVFKSDYYNRVKISQHVLGKCFVMFVKEYFKTKPEGFEEEDVFVCESRYSAKAKAFKKIKIWAMPPSSVKVVPRDEPLSKVRIASVFAGAQCIEPGEASNQTENYQVFDKEREEVLQDMPNEEGLTYYEQVLSGGVFYKLGDSVYLRTLKGKPPICKMDKIWKDKNGVLFFFGPVFIHPSQTKHPPTKMFYQNEVFLSSMENTYPITEVLCKCSVMVYKDYIASRPTEFPEKHVYVCESQYKEVEQQMRKIKGLKRHNVANKVIDDEIYFFKKPITPLKEPSPLLREHTEEGEEGSVKDDEEEEIKSVEAVALMQIAEQLSAIEDPEVPVPIVSTPKTTKEKDGTKKPPHPSGFILFASENRAECKRRNPDNTFGELSRMIGLEWHKLPKAEKAKYEERAVILAASRPPKPDKPDKPEKASKDSHQAIDQAALMQSQPPGSMQVYECGWEGCDYMYEDMDDLIVHVVDQSGHLRSARENQFLCCWKSCVRFKKNQPFPVYSRLVRHCKEVHMKHSARFVFPHQLSRNYYSRAALHGPNAARPSTPGTSAVMGVVGPPTPVGMATQQINQSGYGMPGGMGDMYGVGMMGGPGHGGPHGSPYHPHHHHQGMPQYPPGMQPNPQGQLAPPGMQPPPHVGMLPPHQQPGMMQGPYGMPRGQAVSPHAGAHSPAYSQGGVPPGQQSMPAQFPVMPPQPMFVPAPPRTQRLLHSEAYIKYIEGLNNKSDTISDWKRNLSVGPETATMTDQQKAKLPKHWFADGVLGDEKDVLKALWNMRDIMLNDSLRISRTLDFETYSARNGVPDGVENGV